MSKLEQDYAAEQRMRGAAKDLYNALSVLVISAEMVRDGLKGPESLEFGIRKALDAIAKVEGK